MKITLVLFCVAVLVCSNAQYQIPEVKFEAFAPKGLRVSVPAQDKLERFAIHLNIGNSMEEAEPGDINAYVTNPSKGRFTYFDPEIQLNKDVVIYYWVFVQHDKMGFKKPVNSWKVDKLIDIREFESSTGAICYAQTKVLGQGKVCPETKIIDDTFSGNKIKPEIWTIEEYIPTAPDWPFNIYQKDPSVIQIIDEKLQIRPKVKEENIYKVIDFGDRCTRKGNQCKTQNIGILNPPIVSAQLRSTAAFCFGNITIRAKLPIGDYVYSEIYLEDIYVPERRLIIAFVRGNANYEKNNIDIGGKVLFGGPQTNASNVIDIGSGISKYCNEEHIGQQWHTFKVYWTSKEIQLVMDQQYYGYYSSADMQNTGFDKDNMVRLVLGVGVAGPFAFPDGYTSSGRPKPYRSMNNRAIKNFINDKIAWESTWGQKTKLLVDYVTVTSI
ncbi:beta-1,3-glucan-binding protein-like [Euwallacea fornicatus]|uniref:beta-1,3-glucan-binding protein-like n=1 Tax=Euwallacea fornicatus TaxID=995702 RepID=UPI00338E6794